jgi:nitroreductase
MDGSIVLGAISSRHCQRAFLGKPVPRQVLESVLAAAGQAPSGKNTQPWAVTVVGGVARDELSAELCSVYDAGEKPAPDYEYSLLPEPEEWKDRARACGFALFALKEIARDDVSARRAHGRENFTFFGAPLQLIFHLPADAARGNFLDTGMFMQNLMLGLTAHGLGSCPQFSVAGYPDVVRRVLGLAEDRWIISGMSVGWPVPAAPVNTFVPERLPLEDFVDWQMT